MAEFWNVLICCWCIGLEHRAVKSKDVCATGECTPGIQELTGNQARRGRMSQGPKSEWSEEDAEERREGKEREGGGKGRKMFDVVVTASRRTIFHARVLPL